MSFKSQFEHLDVLYKRIATSSIPKKEDLIELMDLISKMNRDLEKRIAFSITQHEENILRIERLEDEVESLKVIEISEALAHGFIEYKNLYDEYEFFVNGELSKTMHDVFYRHNH